MKRSYQTHFFIAIPLPENLRQLLKQYEMENKEKFIFKKWVHQEDYHITLAFLGFVTKPVLDRLRNRLQEVVNHYSVFTLEATNFEIFAKRDQPRIFWLGVKPSECLQQLQREISNVCIDEGIQLDNRPYRPHITVARKWNGEHPFILEEANKRFVIDPQKTVFPVKEIVLFQSHLDKLPMYERKETFYLN